MIDGGRGIHFVRSTRSYFFCVNLVRFQAHSIHHLMRKKRPSSHLCLTCSAVERCPHLHVHTYLPFRKSNPKSFLQYKGRGSVWSPSTRKKCKGEKGGSHRHGRGSEINIGTGMKRKHRSELSSLPIPSFHILTSLIAGVCPQGVMKSGERGQHDPVTCVPTDACLSH